MGALALRRVLVDLQQHVWNEKYSLCLDIYVVHHQMERTAVTLPDVVQHVDMALVHIHKCIGRKLLGLVLTGTPLIDRSIQLKIIRMAFKEQLNDILQLSPPGDDA
jgi:hypothetical protein